MSKITLHLECENPGIATTLLNVYCLLSRTGLEYLSGDDVYDSTKYISDVLVDGITREGPDNDHYYMVYGADIVEPRHIDAIDKWYAARGEEK